MGAYRDFKGIEMLLGKKEEGREKAKYVDTKRSHPVT